MRSRILQLYVILLVMILAAVGCSEGEETTTPESGTGTMHEEGAPASQLRPAPSDVPAVNLVDKAGLSDTTKIEILELDTEGEGTAGVPYTLRATITDPEVISQWLTTLEGELEPAPRLACIPDHQLKFHLKDGTTQQIGYNCGETSFVRGEQDFWKGNDYTPQGEFDSLVRARLESLRPFHVNLVKQAGLDETAKIQVLFTKTSPVPGKPVIMQAEMVEFLTVADAAVIAGIVSSLDTDLGLEPRAMTPVPYSLAFHLGSGEVLTIGYAPESETSGILRGGQNFWGGQDGRVPGMFVALMSEYLTEPLPVPLPPGPAPQGATMIELRVGDTHTVSLESNPTTGYRWEVGFEFDHRYLELIEQSYEPDSSLVGGGGHESFTFRALAFGMVEFSFNYKRPWEDQIPKTGRYIFNIGVPAALADEMTEEEAREIAANSECGEAGPLKENAVYNDWSGTWWIDLDAQREGCNPACVVWVATRQAEINWRCMGVLPPPTDEVQTPVSPTPPPTGAAMPGYIELNDPQLGYRFEYPESWQMQRPEVADGEDVQSVVMFAEPGTPTTLVVTVKSTVLESLGEVKQEIREAIGEVGGTILEEKEIMVGGRKGFEVVYKPIAVVEIRQIILLVNSKAYVLACSTADALYHEYGDVFDHIVNSLVIE